MREEWNDGMLEYWIDAATDWGQGSIFDISFQLSHFDHGRVLRSLVRSRIALISRMVLVSASVTSVVTLNFQWLEVSRGKVPTIGSFVQKSSNHWKFFQSQVSGLSSPVFFRSSSARRCGWRRFPFRFRRPAVHPCPQRSLDRRFWAAPGARLQHGAPCPAGNRR